MAIEQANVVDEIRIDRTTGETVLSLFDAMDWTAPEDHLALLGGKVAAYLSFIRSGDFLNPYPAARSRSARVDFIFRFNPVPAAVELLAGSGQSPEGPVRSIAWRVQPGG